MQEHVLAKQTRRCIDPWSYLEITPSEGLKPCCKISSLSQWDPNVPLIDAWRADEFKQLRKQLAEGGDSLNRMCMNCHIRPWTSVAEFQKRLQELGLASDPGPLRYLRIEMTKACNLRCTYCAVSQPEYKAQSMTAQTLEKILDLLPYQDPSILELHINGHGETTIHPNWLPFAQSVLAMGFRPHLITNLSKELSDEEVQTLAWFSTICISLDTVNANLLGRLRRGANLAIIENNLQRIQASVRDEPPTFSLSCGVYDKTIDGLNDLLAFCQQYGIAKVVFWQLVKYPDVPDALNAQPITSLPLPQQRKSIKKFEDAVNSLLAGGISVEIAGGFLDEWKELLLCA